MSADFDAQLSFDASDAVVFNDEAGDHVLPHVDVGVGLQCGAPFLGKGVSVVLSSGGPHGRAF